MIRAGVVLAAASALVMVGAASAVSWQTPVGTNVVADGVITGGGYPVAPGATRPDPGTCRSGLYNANRSESWIAVKPGTETLIGNSKIFFEKYSTFYDFHLGTVTIQNGAVTGSHQDPGVRLRIDRHAGHARRAWLDPFGPVLDGDRAEMEVVFFSDTSRRRSSSCRSAARCRA